MSNALEPLPRKTKVGDITVAVSSRCWRLTSNGHPRCTWLACEYMLNHPDSGLGHITRKS